MPVLETAPARRRIVSASPSMVALIITVAVVGIGTAASVFLGGRASVATWWPFVVLAICVGLIITLITVVRVHAFLALIVAAIAAGLLSLPGTLPGEPAKSHWVQAVELTTAEFGKTAGGIGVVIALASVIGMCMLESGAADKVVRRFLALFGVQRAGLALLVSTYIVSIPIFFDTIFMLLVPLAKALRLRTGKDYLLYLMAICCSGVITHSMIIPHPGPAAMAEALRVDVGLTIIMGLLTGIIPAAVGWFVATWINRRMEVPLVESAGSSWSDLQALIDKPEEELPSLTASIMPILLPVALIALGSIAFAFGREWPSAVRAWAEFLGNRNTALLIGTVISIGILMRQRQLNLSQVAKLIGAPLETAGVIILITAAGGAFGLMLRNAGVGDAIKAAASGYNVNLIVLAWVVALIIRIAQGSATVAMLTTSAMIYPLMTTGTSLGYHPIYIFLSIGWGAMGVSWMNDSGFWVVGRLGGLTERQTLKSWTILLAAISVAGLLTAVALSIIMPFPPGTR